MSWVEDRCWSGRTFRSGQFELPADRWFGLVGVDPGRELSAGEGRLTFATMKLAALLLAASMVAVGCGNATAPSVAESSDDVTTVAPRVADADVCAGQVRDDFDFDFDADPDAVLSEAGRLEPMLGILQRWNGDDWEAIALIPFDLTTPGQLIACDLDGPCQRPAVDAPLPPRRTGRERAFRLRPLEDGTYRMTELNDRGYTVDSNHIIIENSSITE